MMSLITVVGEFHTSIVETLRQLESTGLSGQKGWLELQK